MARMSREFSLVLLGAGLLSAGYFLIPEEDPIKIANDEASGKGGGSDSRGRARVGHVFFFYAGGGPRAFATSSSATSSATSRGGFGRIGSSISGS